mmetsp:Transcript_112807/g.329633  ORF Transcript_112807/g.329633 Transcript_112807/m.329633 type:complete len:230 (+) Transcript_112807:855-1544(+)
MVTMLRSRRPQHLSKTPLMPQPRQRPGPQQVGLQPGLELQLGHLELVKALALGRQQSVAVFLRQQRQHSAGTRCLVTTLWRQVLQRSPGPPHRQTVLLMQQPRHSNWVQQLLPTVPSRMLRHSPPLQQSLAAPLAQQLRCGRGPRFLPRPQQRIKMLSRTPDLQQVLAALQMHQLRRRSPRPVLLKELPRQRPWSSRVLQLMLAMLPIPLPRPSPAPRQTLAIPPKRLQ